MAVDLSFLADATLWAAVGSLATASALVLLVIDARHRGQREEQAQAAKVSAWMTEFYEKNSVATLSNASDTPVYRAIVSLIHWQGGGGPMTGEEAAKVYLPALVGVLPPGRCRVQLPPFDGGMYARPGVEVAFTDATNRHWVRRYDGHLERMSREAAEHYRLGLPLDWGAAVDAVS